MSNKTKKKSWNVNAGIARSHQLAGQLVGLQLSIANVLALVVSAASVVAGATMLAVQQFPHAWPLWLAAAGIGIGLALLIEGLTLGALIRIRLARRELNRIQVSLDEECKTHLKTIPFPRHEDENYPILKKRYHDSRKIVEREYRRTWRQRSHQIRRDRRNSLLQAGGGCIASMCAGGLFYHAILSNMGQLVSVLLSVVFTLAVTGTFLSSEIFKDLQEQAIRESFANGNLAESAMRQATRMQSLWAVYNQTNHFFESPEAQRVITESGNLLINSIVEDLRQDLSRAFMPEKTTASVSEEMTSAQAIEGQTHQVQVSMEQPLSPALLALNKESHISSGQMTGESIKNREITDQRGLAEQNELDGIGQMMFQKLKEIEPAEYKELLECAQASTSDVRAMLQHRYPKYAPFFTEKRINQIIQLIAQHQDAGSVTDNRVSHIVHHDVFTHQTTLQHNDDQQSMPSQLISDDAQSIQIKHQDRASTDQVLAQSQVSPFPQNKRRPRERLEAVLAQEPKRATALTQRELAQLAEVSIATVQRYMHKKRQVIRENSEDE